MRLRPLGQSRRRSAAIGIDCIPSHSLVAVADLMLAIDPNHHDAVIFDCDGTLVDTMPLHFAAWRTAFEKHGAPFEFTWELFHRRAGMTLEKTVEALNVEFNCHLPTESVAADQRAQYRQRAQTVEPIAHVVDFARTVSASHPTAVASGSNRATVEDALRRVGIDACFRVIVTPSDVTEGKPAPDLFLLAATKLGVAPERCLVIEDGDLGLEAARRAHMDAFRVDASGAAIWLPAPDRQSRKPCASNP